MVGQMHSPDKVIITWRMTAPTSTDSRSKADHRLAVTHLGHDLHVIVHSEVLQKVFVLESDWPLIIADFLAGEDNVWMDDIPEATLAKCKKELKNFRFRDDTFLRILEDGKSTATYVHYDQRSKVIRHYHESLAHLKYGSIIGLMTRRFLVAVHEERHQGLHFSVSTVPTQPIGLRNSFTFADSTSPPQLLCLLSDGGSTLWSNAENQVWKQVPNYRIDYATRWVLAKPVKEMTEVCCCCLPLRLDDDLWCPLRDHLGSRQVFFGRSIDLFERENKIRHLATNTLSSSDQWDGREDARYARSLI
ncbi:hypothetical protein BASA83_012504 [Batrachochytrium salamandrivorans]|nr:hypothetical protein BASA83_012504 [Batrachochytrium salamandrivorans]